MTLLVLGMLLWAAVHFIPTLAPNLRMRLVTCMGENGYKVVFSLFIALSVLLIVQGWKAAPIDLLFVPPPWGRKATSVLVLAGCILFFASYIPNNLRRVIRHPQLLGVAAWSVGHYLSNGETRTAVLFGGLGLWVAMEIILITRRDARWQKPDSVPRWGDIKLALAGLAFYFTLLFSHDWLFGVSPMPF